ncbi:hypothetical protein B0J14DRAFT_571532 [Halenospora varia]|nr:hypothetical protein B0J14DRAFT_571532 [Halenospora varia]
MSPELRNAVKRRSEGVRNKGDTLVKKAHCFGKEDGVQVAVIVFRRCRYHTYSSSSQESWPPSIEEIKRAYPLPKCLQPQDVEEKSEVPDPIATQRHHGHTGAVETSEFNGVNRRKDWVEVGG